MIGPKWPTGDDLDAEVRRFEAESSEPSGASNKSFAAVRQTARGIVAGWRHQNKKEQEAEA